MGFQIKVRKQPLNHLLKKSSQELNSCAEPIAVRKLAETAQISDLVVHKMEVLLFIPIILYNSPLSSGSSYNPKLAEAIKRH